MNTQMLKRASAGDYPFIEDFCNEGICSIKILCQLKAYGFERDFLECWTMLDDEKITAVIVKFFDDVTFIASENADFEQLEVFFDMFYWNSVMCTEWLCEKMQFDNSVIKKAYRYSAKADIESCDKLIEDDFSDAYKLISREIPGSFKEDKEAYLSFFSDYTFRERRLLARGSCTKAENKLASVAITSAETDNNAIISGVACDRSLRKKGLGKSTVLSIAAALLKDGKTPHVIALNESAEGFYEHIGFTFSEKIAFVERKK